MILTPTAKTWNTLGQPFLWGNKFELPSTALQSIGLTCMAPNRPIYIARYKRSGNEVSMVLNIDTPQGKEILCSLSTNLNVYTNVYNLVPISDTFVSGSVTINYDTTEIEQTLSDVQINPILIHWQLV